MAKSVQLSYAIEIAKPLSLFVEPLKIHTVVISTKQMFEPTEHSKEKNSDYTTPEATETSSCSSKNMIGLDFV